MVLAYDLCKEGWKLYDRWNDLLELGAEERADIAREAFERHKSTCPQCHVPDFNGS